MREIANRKLENKKKIKIVCSPGSQRSDPFFKCLAN